MNFTITMGNTVFRLLEISLGLYSVFLETWPWSLISLGLYSVFLETWPWPLTSLGFYSVFPGL